jgi:hypothetical protein
LVVNAATKSWSLIWNSLDLSCPFCAICKSVFTDCRDKLTMYYYISYLDMVTIAQTKWKPDFSVIHKNTPLLIKLSANIYIFWSTLIYLPYFYLIINTITPGNLYLTSKNENGGGGAKKKYSNMRGGHH